MPVARLCSVSDIGGANTARERLHCSGRRQNAAADGVFCRLQSVAELTAETWWAFAVRAVLRVGVAAVLANCIARSARS